MVSVMEFLQVGVIALANKDSSAVEKYITDDFEMVTPSTTLSRQGFLDWVAAGGSPTVPSNFEVIYENDEVAAVYHDVQSANTAVGTKAMCVGSKRDGNKVCRLPCFSSLNPHRDELGCSFSIENNFGG